MESHSVNKMKPVALVLCKSCGQFELKPGLSLHEWRQHLLSKMQSWTLWKTGTPEPATSTDMQHTSPTEKLQRKMPRSWKDEIIWANYSRIKLIASKGIGPEKGGKSGNWAMLEGCKFHRKTGVQCKIIYNSETNYSTGPQNWKSWRRVWKLNAISW